MKKLLLLTKTLLAAALLCVGQNAWAETITYDFTKISESSLTKSANVAGYAIQGTYKWELYFPTQLSSSLNNQFAFQYREDSDKTNEVSVDHAKGGLFVYHKAGKDEVFAITNLCAGDKVTITIKTGSAKFYSSHTNATYDNDGVETTPNKNDAVVSGKEYKIKGDGLLELTTSKSGNFVIEKVVIERKFTRVWSENFRTFGVQVAAAAGADNINLTRTLAIDDTYYNIKYGDYSVNTNFGVNNDDAWRARYKGSSSPAIGIWSQSKAGTMAIANLTRGQFVVFWSGVAVSAGTKVVKTNDWSGDSYYTFQVIEDGTATFTVPSSSSYIYSVGVYNYPNEIVGAMDCSTGYTASIDGTVHKDLSISQGEKLKLNFDTHGSGANDYNNWALRIINSGTSFDRTLAGGNHINGAYDGITQSWKVDGVSKTVEEFRAADFKTQMMDANVDLTIEYSAEGMFSVEAVAVGSEHTYTYNMSYGTAFSGDVTMELGVDCAWLEIFSLDKYALATIGSTGWTTFASSYPLDLSSMTASTGEVAAYYASAVGGGNVTMTSTESDAVAAGTGIMLKGTASATITIPVAASAGTAISGNKLIGCTTETDLEANDNYYVLVNNGGTAEFQCLDNYGATIPAGKAYLNNEGGSARALRIVFDDITGVANVEAAAEAKAKEGKFIENGKLVIVKNGVKYNAAGAQVK